MSEHERLLEVLCHIASVASYQIIYRGRADPALLEAGDLVRAAMGDDPMAPTPEERIALFGVVQNLAAVLAAQVARNELDSGLARAAGPSRRGRLTRSSENVPEYRN